MIESRVRMSIVGVIVLALFSALFARLWYLQVAASGEYAAAAQSNSVRVINEPPIRGRILDAKGRPLVENRIANVITIDRKLPEAKLKMVVNRLAELLSVSSADIRKKLDDPRVSPYTPVPVAVDVPYAALAYVSEHREDFPGVRAEPLAIRSYVYGSLAAHVLGYVGEINQAELNAQSKSANYELGDSIGKGGVELTYESDLRGVPGADRVEVDSTGRVVRTLTSRKPRPGNDVQLTVDLDVQKLAEDSLAQGLVAARATQDKSFKKGFKTLAAPAGSVVVLDATNGSVVAMASNPTYDPNNFANGIPTPLWQQLNDPKGNFPLIDRVIAGQYAPGSTFKLITAVAGLQSGQITPTKTIDDRGQYAYPTDPGRLFRNDNGARYGRVDLPRAITVSSDVYFYTIGGDLYYRKRHAIPGGDALQETARQYGFGKATGVGLPNEAIGRVPDATWKQKIHDVNPAAFPYPDWLPGDNILSAVGQGDMLVTPLQLANAYAAFANGGTLHEPRLASEVLDARGKKVRDLAPINLGQVPVPARDAMITGFTGVAEAKGGTAVNVFAGFPPGLVAGKTGTAQVQGKQPTSLFVGMSPAANPRYIVLAVVEEGGYGAETAAPIVRRIMQGLNGLPLTDVATLPPAEGN
ncbi:MAG: penicillin-binding protein 2 [Acidimicrobiia bacterium]